MSSHRIAVLTSTRADFGILQWLLDAIHDDPACELLLYVTGTHLSSAFGSTIEEIVNTGLPIAREIAILPGDDSSPDPAAAMARALESFAPALVQDQPDILILLGDRYEIVPVALAAVLNRIPVCHIHGGEISEGALDEYFRHAVTKLSALHFPATEEYRRRVIQMGENPDNVINHGAPGLDHLSRTTLLDRNSLAEALEFPLESPVAVVTYHPVTTEPSQAGIQAEAVLRAVLETKGLQAIVTKANADAAGGEINAVLEDRCNQYPDRLKLYDNLGSRRYFSCLKHANILVGNTSSGLIEAPSFACPVVDVGNRQKGRLKAKNVISTGNDMREIQSGICTALSTEFNDSLRGMKNPYDRYGDGRVSERILNSIKSFLGAASNPGKHFFDLDIGCAQDV